MRDDTCVVGYAHNQNHRRKDGKLIDPQCGVHTASRNGHFMVQKPKPYRLGQQHYEQGDAGMDLNARRENLEQLFRVFSTQLESKIPLGTCRHGGIYETKHGNYAANHIIDAKILHSQSVQHDT